MGFKVSVFPPIDSFASLKCLQPGTYELQCWVTVDSVSKSRRKLAHRRFIHNDDHGLPFTSPHRSPLLSDCQTPRAQAIFLMLLFSLLIASVGAASTTGIGSSPSPSPSPSPSSIKNHCGSDGVVPDSYMVTLNTPSKDRSAPTSTGLNTNQGDLSYLSGWFQQYNQDNLNRRKLEAGSNPTRAIHYFIQTQLAVAIEASDDVRQPTARTNPHPNHAGPMSSASTCPLCLSHCPTLHTFAQGCHEHGYRPGRLLG